MNTPTCQFKANGIRCGAEAVGRTRRGVYLCAEHAPQSPSEQSDRYAGNTVAKRKALGLNRKARRDKAMKRGRWK